MVILLAGDDADLLRVLSYALRRRGFDTVAAPFGEWALTCSRPARAPALVIVDDGGRKREIPTSPVATGRVGPAVQHILLTARLDSCGEPPIGWAAVLPKPIRIADLGRIIEALRIPEGGQSLHGPVQAG